MKIALIGSDGQLGCDLCRVITKETIVPLTIREIDITDKERTLAVLRQHRPDVVINTAAYHRVDDCEDQAELAFQVNEQGVGNVAAACRELDAALVHISTDYVFRGDKKTPYTEADRPDPQSVYGRSKLAGEQQVQTLLKKYYLVRSAGLYGTTGCLGKGGGNFVDNMIARAETQPELRVVNDEIVSPTYTLDLAAKLGQLLGTGRYGLYHIANHGHCSWYEFTVEIFKLLGRSVKIKAVSGAEFQAKAPRPKNSALANAALARLGLDDLRDWRSALQAYLREKGLI